MKFNKQWFKDRLSEKSTYISLIAIATGAFGIKEVVPADLLAQVLASLAAGIFGGMGIALETKKDK